MNFENFYYLSWFTIFLRSIVFHNSISNIRVGGATPGNSHFVGQIFVGREKYFNTCKTCRNLPRRHYPLGDYHWHLSHNLLARESHCFWSGSTIAPGTRRCRQQHSVTSVLRTSASSVCRVTGWQEPVSGETISPLGIKWLSPVLWLIWGCQVPRYSNSTNSVTVPV